MDGNPLIGSGLFMTKLDLFGYTIRIWVGCTGMEKMWTTPGYGRKDGIGPGQAIKFTHTLPKPLETGCTISREPPTPFVTTTSIWVSGWKIKIFTQQGLTELAL